MQQITAIGFDLFDTLITVHNLGLQEALDRLVRNLQAQGLALEHETFLPVYRQTAREFVEEAHKDGRETHNRFWVSTALHRVGLHLPPEDRRIADAVEAYFSAFLDHARLLPGTLEMLQTLGGRYRLGLLSNFTHAPAVQAILARLGLDACLDIQLISGDLGYRKPHGRVFQELIHQFGVPKEHIAFVGDDLQADVTGAQQAGLQPIWTTYARQYKASLTTDTEAGPGPNPNAPIRAPAARPRPAPAMPDADSPAPGVPMIASWDELLTLLGTP